MSFSLDLNTVNDKMRDRVPGWCNAAKGSFASVIKIGPQSERKPIGVPYQDEFSTMRVCAISRLGIVYRSQSV